MTKKIESKITIEQLRRALVKNREINEIALKNVEFVNLLNNHELESIKSATRMITDIIDIIDNPEKYKHLWEDGK